MPFFPASVQIPARWHRIGLVASLLVALCLDAADVSAQEDFALEGEGWNSISELTRIAAARGIPVESPERLDIGTLGPDDSLLILNPREPLPTVALSAFLRNGGRIALADDYGAGDELLRVFQIVRGEPDPSGALQLRGNPALLVARPEGRHRLTEGVPALVTNHPAIVHHPQLSPVFDLGHGQALVLAGAVGAGRLVVVADPSLFIDNMMELRGNRRFAENLLEYLSQGGGHLFVVRPTTAVAGRYGEPGADRPLHDLRRALETIATLELPPLAIRISSLALAAIAAILAFGALPRRSPYRSERMFARPASQGGFAGRVAFFSRSEANLLQPLMVYKFELEDAILQKLSLGGKTLLRDVVSAMRAHGIDEADVSAMRALLLELDQLRDRAEGPQAPRVSRKRFSALVATGERLLARLDRLPEPS